MGIVFGFAIYFVIWWMTLFITLPFRNKSQAEQGYVVEGSEQSAPADPQLLKRMLWNTVLSLVVFFLFWFVFYYLDFGIDSLPEIVPIRRINE